MRRLLLLASAMIFFDVAFFAAIAPLLPEYVDDLGLSKAQAGKFNKPEGKSFHFVLNDITVKDNRIPPRGFTRAAFASRLCAPVGAEYADGQYWDDLEFPMPAGTDRVEVRLGAVLFAASPVLVQALPILSAGTPASRGGTGLIQHALPVVRP